MTHPSWRSLGAPVVEPDAEFPPEEFAFVANPLALLSDEEARELRDDLADLTRLRREVESEGASLRLA